jgi:hypothetical protein
MARYRIGNRFLSQEEYDAEMDWRWVCGLFLIGAIGTGILVHSYFVNPEWHKLIRFLVTVIPSIAIGFLLVRLRYFIMVLVGLLILLFVVSLIVSIISSMI